MDAYFSVRKSAKQRLNPDLRVRYNVGENLRTIKIVLPFCYASCVFTSIFLAIMCTIIFFHESFTKAIYYALVDGSMLLPAYGLILPTIIKRMNAKVNEKSNSEFQRHIAPGGGNEVAAVYFDTLTSAWRGEKTKKFDKFPKFSRNYFRIKNV
ncbi:hypothetical protein ANCDUO_17220 [Ancylostoma duodenale]|uniref:Uncharacterized protein n=1 Tax=Ancylostoma duodenale TaxID=51022 RepID=A0A0C2G6I3_9BILA|nr:hypothetical protein ANCDUO_17220 [Ancylostoma duodenale]